MAKPKQPMENPFTVPMNPYSDKNELIEKRVLFTVESIVFEPGKGVEGGDRWNVAIRRNDVDGEAAREQLTLPSNEQRNEQMKAAQDFIKAQGPMLNMCLVKSGRAHYISVPRKTEPDNQTEIPF